MIFQFSPFCHWSNILSVKRIHRTTLIIISNLIFWMNILVLLASLSSPKSTFCLWSKKFFHSAPKIHSIRTCVELNLVLKRPKYMDFSKYAMCILDANTLSQFGNSLPWLLIRPTSSEGVFTGSGFVSSLGRRNWEEE